MRAPDASRSSATSHAFTVRHTHACSSCSILRPSMATVVATKTKEERANQRNAVLAGFLGWTLDAFDFFVLAFVIEDVARAFGRSRPDIALTITLALAMRPLGALIFGMLADRFGRRIPLMTNVIFYAI